jgi:hypothetical protein
MFAFGEIRRVFLTKNIAHYLLLRNKVGSKSSSPCQNKKSKPQGSAFHFGVDVARLEND